MGDETVWEEMVTFEKTGTNKTSTVMSLAYRPGILSVSSTVLVAR